MSSDDEIEVVEADSLAASVALKYADLSETWMDALALAREAVIDYRTLVAGIKNPFVEVTDDAGNLHVVYVVDMVPDGKTAPIEYCEERIRDLILSSRKHALEEGLAQDLLENARRQGFTRAEVDGEMVELDGIGKLDKKRKHDSD